MIKHKHHIIPRHVGGTNDPSNIVELTIEEHAEAHHILYEQYGRDEDRLAWLGLSGQIGKDEILKQIAMAQKGKKKPEGFGEKIRQANLGRKHSENAIEKMSLVKKGKYNSEYYRKIGAMKMDRSQPESQKIKVSEKLSAKWELTTPEGITFEVLNLRKYCKDNNLDQGNMSRNLVRGWLCKKIT
jgi:hypothetical protein